MKTNTIPPTLSRTVALVHNTTLLAMLALSVGITQVARATTMTVNSTADIVADDGQCTLRETIIAANTDSASGTMPGECPAGSGADTIGTTA